jgi:hypothetical protein
VPRRPPLPPGAPRAVALVCCPYPYDRAPCGLIAVGHLEVPIVNVYPLAQVREAYTELERRHTRRKIVLRP